MDKKNLLVSAVVSLAVVLIVAPLFKGTVVERVIEQVVGAQSGPDHYEMQRFYGGTLQGHTLSTSSGSITFSHKDLQGFDTVIWNATGAVGNKTLTFFASSTAGGFLPKAGDTQRTCIINATSSASNLILAAGTGIDLQNSSTTATDLSIEPGNVGCLTLIRKPVTSSAFDIMANLTLFRDAD